MIRTEEVAFWERQTVPKIAKPDQIGMSLRSPLLYVAAACVGLMAHLVLARPIYSYYDRLAAWVPLAILLYMLFRFIKRGEKGVPVLILVAFQVYIFYSIPQFSQEFMALYSGLYLPTSGAVVGACFLVVLGEAAFILGFQGMRRSQRNRTNIFDRILPRPSPAWGPALIIYSMPALIVYVLANLRPNYIPVSIRFTVFQIFSVYLALVLILYLAFRFRQSRMLKYAIVLMAVMSITGFIQGMMGNIINPILIFFLCSWIWGGKIQKRWVVLAIIAFVVINPIKNRFRVLEWYDTDVSSWQIVERRLESWKEAAVDVWEGQSAGSNIEESASRTSDILPLARAVDLVPETLPYNHGQGMAIALVYWVPRIIWPSKPSSTDLLYNRYAVEFGYSSVEGTRTSTTGASIYTEGYWNFGWIGVATFLFALGAFLGALFGNNGSTGDVSAIACMTYYAGNMLFLQPLLLTVAAIVTFVVGLWLAMWGLDWLSGATRVH